MTTDSLFDQLKHPNPNIRERAMIALSEAYDQTIIHQLMQNLGEEDVVYRRASVKALGYIGPDAVPALVACLEKSDNPTEKASCAKALTQVAVQHPEEPFPELGLQALQAAMQDLNPVVHISAAMALGEVGLPAIDLLLAALDHTDNLSLGVSIINALAAIGGEQAAAKLTALSQDEAVDTYLRESATSALSRLELVKQYGKKSEA